MNDLSYLDLAQLISKQDNFLILAHEAPDPDAYASSIALALSLKKIGKQVIVYNATGIIQDLSFLPGIDLIISELPELDQLFIIATDSASLKRLGGEFRLKLGQRKVDLNIDHHISNEHFAKVNFVQEVSSCSEIIYKIIKFLGIVPDPQIANLILTGIYSDTGSLQYKGVNAETFRVVAELLEAGADIQTFSQKLYQEKSLAVLKLQSKMFENVELAFNNQYAYLAIPDQWITDFNVNSEELHHIKDIFRNISGVIVSATIRNDQGLWKASLRSVDPIDVNKISNTLGGGGHTQAAGIKWKGELSEFISKLNLAVEQELKDKKCL